MIQKGFAAIASGESNWTKNQVRKHAGKRMQGVRHQFVLKAQLKAMKSMSVQDAMKVTGRMLDKWEHGVERLIARTSQFRDAVALARKVAHV